MTRASAWRAAPAQRRALVATLYGAEHPDLRGWTEIGRRSFGAVVVRTLRNKGYVDAYMAAGAGEAGTFPLLWPFRIDYIFVPQIMQPHLQSCQVQTGKLIEQASDHRPLMATFDWI